MSKVRLNPQEIDIIIQAFRHFFPVQDHLWLFGSRTNPHAKGGDIDLYIETTIIDPKAIVEKKIAMVNELYQQLGEQKIDVVINKLNNDNELPIYKTAKTEGVLLA